MQETIITLLSFVIAIIIVILLERFIILPILRKFGLAVQKETQKKLKKMSKFCGVPLCIMLDNVISNAYNVDFKSEIEKNDD